MSDYRLSPDDVQHTFRSRCWFYFGHVLSLLAKWSPRGVLWGVLHRPYRFAMLRSVSYDPECIVWERPQREVGA